MPKMHVHACTVFLTGRSSAPLLRAFLLSVFPASDMPVYTAAVQDALLNVLRVGSGQSAASMTRPSRQNPNLNTRTIVQAELVSGTESELTVSDTSSS